MKPPVTEREWSITQPLSDSDQDPDLHIEAAYSEAEQAQFPASSGHWIATVRRFDTVKEQKAAARVMVAAPQLAKALNELVSRFAQVVDRFSPYDDARVNRAIVALKKAGIR